MEDEILKISGVKVEFNEKFNKYLAIELISTFTYLKFIEKYNSKNFNDQLENMIKLTKVSNDSNDMIREVGDIKNVTNREEAIDYYVKLTKWNFCYHRNVIFSDDIIAYIKTKRVPDYKPRKKEVL